MTSGSLEISSFEDLRGKTVYAPAQNPTFIFRYLCEANGLTPGEDIVIDNSYAQPADLNTAVSSGAVQLTVHGDTQRLKAALGRVLLFPQRLRRHGGLDDLHQLSGALNGRLLPRPAYMLGDDRRVPLLAVFV